jgi:hypothetical protein
VRERERERERERDRQTWMERSIVDLGTENLRSYFIIYVISILHFCLCNEHTEQMIQTASVSTSDDKILTLGNSMLACGHVLQKNHHPVISGLLHVFR